MDGLKDRPEARNLVNIYAALSGETGDQVLARFEGQGFGAFKPALAEVAVEVLAPITERMSRFMADPAEIDRILGAARIRRGPSPSPSSSAPRTSWA
jgi:tryptophanyl-tRNA synthetase